MALRSLSAILLAAITLTLFSCNKSNSGTNTTPSNNTPSNNNPSNNNPNNNNPSTTPSKMLELTINGQKVTGNVLYVGKNVMGTKTQVLINGTFPWHGRTQGLSISISDYKGIKAYTNDLTIHFSQYQVSPDTIWGGLYSANDTIDVKTNTGVYIEGTFAGELYGHEYNNMGTPVDTVYITNGKFVGKW